MKVPEIFKFTAEQKKKLPIWFAIEFAGILAYLALDLLTKHFLYGPMANGSADIILIKGVLRLTPVENTGASFGIFSDKTSVLTIVSIVTAVILIIVWAVTIKERNGIYRASLVLIIAGAVGNIADRLVFGYVRDFIYFELIDFAVFNLADSGLCVGAGLLIIYILFFYLRADKTNKNGDKARNDAKNNEVNQ